MYKRSAQTYLRTNNNSLSQARFVPHHDPVARTIRSITPACTRVSLVKFIPVLYSLVLALSLSHFFFVHSFVTHISQFTAVCRSLFIVMVCEIIRLYTSHAKIHQFLGSRQYLVEQFEAHYSQSILLKYTGSLVLKAITFSHHPNIFPFNGLIA